VSAGAYADVPLFLLHLLEFMAASPALARHGCPQVSGVGR
jgi:hypothetical protein